MIDWNKPIEFMKYDSNWVPARVICKDRKSPRYGNTYVILYGTILDGENTYLCNDAGHDGSSSTHGQRNLSRVRNVPEVKTVYQTHVEKKKTSMVTTTFKPELAIGGDAKQIGHPGWTVVKINELTIQAAA